MLNSEPTTRPRTAPPARRQGRTFATRRAGTIDRLVRAGMPTLHAESWIDAWDESTAGLNDFRAASDYWELAFQYALEERRRGYGPPGLGRQVAERPRRQIA